MIGQTYESPDHTQAFSRNIEAVLPYAVDAARFGIAHGWDADRIVWEVRQEARARGLSLPRLREDPWQNDHFSDAQRRCAGVYRLYRGIPLERVLRLVLITDVERHEAELVEDRRRARL